MPRFTIKATVAVDVEMSIEAKSKQHAQDLFRDKIVMTAELLDLPPAEWDVSEDSIANIDDLSVVED